jgi:hypothetical protein
MSLRRTKRPINIYFLLTRQPSAFGRAGSINIIWRRVTVNFGKYAIFVRLIFTPRAKSTKDQCITCIFPASRQ